MNITQEVKTAIRNYFKARCHTYTIAGQVLTHMFKDSQSKSKCLNELNEATIQAGLSLAVMPGLVVVGDRDGNMRHYTHKNWWVGKKGIGV